MLTPISLRVRYSRAYTVSGRWHDQDARLRPNKGGHMGLDWDAEGITKSVAISWNVQ